MKNNKGFTLIEVVIAIAIMAIVATTIAMVFDISIKANTTQMTKADNQMNVRYAATYLREKIKDAETIGLRHIPNSEYSESGPRREVILIDEDEKEIRFNLDGTVLDISENGIIGPYEPLIPNIKKFYATYSADRKLLIINIESVKDEEHEGTLVKETIVMDISDKKKYGEE